MILEWDSVNDKRKETKRMLRVSLLSEIKKKLDKMNGSDKFIGVAESDWMKLLEWGIMNEEIWMGQNKW